MLRHEKYSPALGNKMIGHLSRINREEHQPEQIAFAVRDYTLSAMNVDCNQWTNKDGTFRETFTFVCSHYKRALGTKQCRRNGKSAERLEREVLEYTKKLLRNPKFARDIKAKIGVAVDVMKIQEEINNYEKELKRLARSRINLEQDIDNLSDERYAERKRNEFNRRLDKI